MRISDVIYVWNESFANILVNFCKEIDEFIELCVDPKVGADCIFLAENNSTRQKLKCFKREHLGINTVGKTVEIASVKEALCGSSCKIWSTTHGLSGMLTSLLFAFGQSCSSVSLLAGHRDPRPHMRYH